MSPIHYMLGDKIGEVKGKIMGERILDVEGPKIEYSFSANGRMKGVDITHLATFWTIPRGNGVLYGEGQGVMTTTDGSGEIATEVGHGLGQLTERGKKGRFRGSFFYRASPTGKLALLNNVVGMFEYEVDEAGNTFHEVWEWIWMEDLSESIRQVDLPSPKRDL